MKKKFLSFVLAICLLLPCAFALTACGENPPEDPPTATVYTVTEAEWKTNLNLTKSQVQAQTLSCASLCSNQVQLLSNSTQPLTEITSYTVRAEGVNDGKEGWGLVKMTSNGMYTEFYPNTNNVLQEENSGYFDKDSQMYQEMHINMIMLVPFDSSYSQFTYDENKKAYVGTNITSSLLEDGISDPIYHKTAEVSFVNGYLNTIYFEMTDSTFTDVVATFTFTFSDINNTIVDVE